MKLHLGARAVDFPADSVKNDMPDASPLLGDPARLRERLDEDGYLLLRGFHPEDEVLRARDAILAYLARAGAIADGCEPSTARASRRVAPPNMKGVREITHAVPVRAVLEGSRVLSLFAELFAEPARTFDYKWLRATPPGEYTGVHADAVYMGRGSQRLLTCWVPFGQVTPAHGAIALCAGSERTPAYARVREGYGRSDNDRDGYGGWLTLDPLELTDTFGGAWHTTSFAPGDVLVFGMQVLHASFVNETDELRLSCDTRFQPAGDPVDERWVGAGAIEAKRDGGPRVATAAMRRAWGIE